MRPTLLIALRGGASGCAKRVHAQRAPKRLAVGLGKHHNCADLNRKPTNAKACSSPEPAWCDHRVCP